MSEASVRTQDTGDCHSTEAGKATALVRRSVGAANRDRLLKWLTENGGVLFREGQRLRITALGEVADVVAGENLIEVVLTRSLGISSATHAGRDAVAWLRAWIHEHGRTVNRQPMSLAIDNRIYLPSLEGLLRITAEGIEVVPQVENEDHALVSHPIPFQLRVEECTLEKAREGLLAIESVIVAAQSTRNSLAWLVAINGLMCSVIRQRFAGKFLLVHQGPPQSGKTVGAQLLLDALGLGPVLGSASIAGLHAGEFAFVVIDNLERRDWTSDLIKHMLHAATGGERIRSTRTGRSVSTRFDALCHITSIEGLPTPELRRRAISVEYEPPITYYSRTQASQEVVSRRPEIHVAIVMTLQRYLSAGGRAEGSSIMSNFSDHYGAAQAIMGHIGDLLGRSPEWAEGIVRQWEEILGERAQEDHGSDELEVAILGALPRLLNRIDYTHHNVRGQLYITSFGRLAAAIGDGSTAMQLSRRLRHANFSEVTIISPQQARLVRQLRRQGDFRPLGLFVPTPEETRMTEHPSVLRLVGPAEHLHLQSDDKCYFVWNYRGFRTKDRLLSALKTPRDTPLQELDLAALHDAAQLLRRLAEEFQGMSCVVMPNSDGVATHLETLMRESGLECDKYKLHCRRIIKGAKGLTPQDLRQHFHMSVEDGTEPTHIMIVDDVITSGAHYRAAFECIRSRFPSANITGLFVFCATGGVSRAAASSQ